MSGCRVWQQNHFFGHPWLNLRTRLLEISEELGNKSAASCLLSTGPPAKFSRFFVNYLSLSGIYTIEEW
jgi:hypothetical protein